MRVIFISALLFVSGLRGICQHSRAESGFQVNINNSSGELVNIIKAELIKRKVVIKNSTAFSAMMNSETARKDYLSYYAVQLKAAYDSGALRNDILLNIEPAAIQEYGNAALRRFQSVSPGPYLDKVIEPVLGTGIVMYARDTIERYFRKAMPVLDQLTNDALSTLFRNGYDYKGKVENEIRRQIRGLRSKLEFDPLNDLLLEQIENRAITLIRTDPTSIVINNTRRISSKFAANFELALAGVKSAAEASFRELGRSMQVLSDNEKKVGLIIKSMQQDINLRRDSILSLEKVLYQNARIKVTDFKQNALHAACVARNVLEINVLNSYLKDGIGIVNQLDKYKEAAKGIFSGAYLTEMKTRLDMLRTPTLSGVISFCSSSIGTVEQVEGALQGLGIVKGEAAKKVTKFVAGAKVALGIASSLIPPNPLGLISALGGLGGLFGGGPSAEQQMFEEMQNGFKEINARLDNIEQEIKNLNVTVQAMHKDIMRSMEIISAQLDNITQKIELNQEMTSFLIYDKYNLVSSMIEKRPAGLTGLEFYSRWYNSDAINNNNALDALSTFIDSKDNLRNVIRMDFTKGNMYKSYQEIASNEIAAYKDTKALLERIFPDIRSNYGEQNLLALGAQKNEVDNVLSGTRIVPSERRYDYDTATANYINGIFLVALADQYITLQPFFLLPKTDAGNYAPINTLEELLKEYTTVSDKLAPSRRRLKNLLTYINYAVVQQSMLSGHSLIPYISNALFSDPQLYNESIKALQTNELLRKNLCVYLLNNKMDPSDRLRMFELIDSVVVDRKRIGELNSLIRYGGGKLRFNFGDNPSDQSLYLSYTIAGTNNRIVDLPVPDMTTVERRDMIYSDVFYGLLESKQRVVDALIDGSFLSNLPSDKEEILRYILLKKS